MFFDQIICNTFIIIIIALDKYTLVTLKMYDVLSIVHGRDMLTLIYKDTMCADYFVSKII